MSMIGQITLGDKQCPICVCMCVYMSCEARLETAPPITHIGLALLTKYTAHHIPHTNIGADAYIYAENAHQAHFRLK